MLHPYQPWITAALAAIFIAAIAVTIAASIHAAEKVDLIRERKRSEHLDQITKATQRLKVVREAIDRGRIPGQRESS